MAIASRSWRAQRPAMACVMPSRPSSTFATFDRFPTLKLVILESGAGWIGYWLDRLDGVSTATYLGGRAPLRHKPE